jgi:hypothetical protein
VQIIICPNGPRLRGSAKHAKFVKNAFWKQLGEHSPFFAV